MEKNLGLNYKQKTAAQMLATGASEADVLRAVFLISEESTPVKKRKAKKELHEWEDLPEFVEFYRKTVQRVMLPAYSKALQKIVEQIDNEKPWLANKAANDVLTRMAYALGEDDKKITVQIEGMPEIGTPDDE